MSAQTDSYVQGATCINSCIPDGMKLSVLIYIFAQLAGVTTDPNTLIQASVCLNSCIPGDMKMAVLIYLASQITSSGGGGGATLVTVDPQGVRLGASGALVYNTVDETLWINLNGATLWQQLI
jgi:hypothetical protein